MSAQTFGLRPEPADRGLVDDAVAAHGIRIGLGGLLKRRGARAWHARVRGAAAEHGFRWRLRDDFSRTWWPQGIDVGTHDGRGVLVTSWYAQERRGVAPGVRVSFVDLRDARRPRYHHVLLVEPVRGDASVRLDAVRIHAGGVAWVGGRLVVADTFGGLRTFELDDLLQVRKPVFDYDTVLVQSGRVSAVHGDGRRLRYSFVSVEHSDETTPTHLIAGEYGNRGVGDRLVRIALDSTGEVLLEDGQAALELHEPGLWRMQGVCVVAGTWFITTSNGERVGGDLWVGTPGTLTRHRHVLPAGPEDLAYDRAAKVLWSLSEWPGRRRVFAIDPARWR